VLVSATCAVCQALQRPPQLQDCQQHNRRKVMQLPTSSFPHDPGRHRHRRCCCCLSWSLRTASSLPHSLLLLLEDVAAAAAAGRCCCCCLGVLLLSGWLLLLPEWCQVKVPVPWVGCCVDKALEEGVIHH
jgi:hypothetical protein